MSTTTKSRDYLFDNYKAFLVVLVVLGHFIEPCYRNNSALYTLKWFIFSFHMPAFIFISGYFSKRELPLSVLIKKLAVPYLVYQFCYYLLYIVILGESTSYNPILPKFSLWYLMALFVWRALTPYVKKIPYYTPLSIVAGLFIGCVDMQSNFLSIPRILVYFPFFLAGINFDRNILEKFRSPRWRLLSAAAITAFTVLLSWEPVRTMYPVKIFYGRYNYEFLHQTMLEGIFVRLICYGIGFFMTFAFMILITERKTCYSYIGGRTMAVYLFHGLIYTYIKDSTDLLQNINTAPETATLLVFCVVLSVALTIPQLTAFTNAVTALQLPRIPVSVPRVQNIRCRNPFYKIPVLRTSGYMALVLSTIKL